MSISEDGLVVLCLTLFTASSIRLSTAPAFPTIRNVSRIHLTHQSQRNAAQRGRCWNTTRHNIQSSGLNLLKGVQSPKTLQHMHLAITIFSGLLITVVSAQFQFFDSMFGGGGGHGHPHQQHQAPVRGVDWYNGLALDTECESGAYLCPGTMDCVNKPADCPCAHDLVRCVVGEHRVCVSKQGDAVPDVCADVAAFHKGL